MLKKLTVLIVAAKSGPAMVFFSAINFLKACAYNCTASYAKAYLQPFCGFINKEDDRMKLSILFHIHTGFDTFALASFYSMKRNSLLVPRLASRHASYVDRNQLHSLPDDGRRASPKT